MTRDNRFEEVLNDDPTEGGTRNMCEVLDRIEKNGVEKGVEKAQLSNIKSLMETLKFTAQQAMDALQIPKADQSKYAAML